MTFMRANKDDGEIEVFEPWMFEGWIVPNVPPGYGLVRVAAYVEDGKYGCLFIYKKL